MEKNIRIRRNDFCPISISLSTLKFRSGLNARLSNVESLEGVGVVVSCKTSSSRTGALEELLGRYPRYSQFPISSGHDINPFLNHKNEILIRRYQLVIYS